MVVVEARVIDSTHLELAEPIGAHQGEHVIVSVIGLDDEKHEAWISFSGHRLHDAYSEEEPDYPLGLVRESNPEYKG